MSRKLKAPCRYPEHRHSDWRLKNSRHLVCGICHPPAVPDSEIKRRPLRVVEQDPPGDGQGRPGTS